MIDHKRLDQIKRRAAEGDPVVGVGDIITNGELVELLNLPTTPIDYGNIPPEMRECLEQLAERGKANLENMLRAATEKPCCKSCRPDGCCYGGGCACECHE